MAISIAEHKDCMIAMKEFPDKFFDLAIVDPPYGIGDFNQDNAKKKYRKIWKISWNESIPTEEYFTELRRVSKYFIAWGGNYYKEYLTEPGTIIWDKKSNTPHIFSTAEIATTNIFNRVVTFYYQWQGFINDEKARGNNKIHPCQKPVALYEWLLKNYAKPGYKILDTHLGSGSSRIACANLGFDFWGYEIDKEYFDAQEKRFNPQTTLFAGNINDL